MTNVLKNLGQVASNTWTNLLQNPDMMKTQSLILASLALVISRVIIAHISAVQAQNTPDGPYRYREAIRTTIREIGAWVLSFGVLRFLQGKITKPFMGKLLGITEKPNPHAYSFLADMKDLFQGNKVHPLELKLHESGTTTFDKDNKLYRALTEAKPLQGFIKNMYQDLGETAQKEAFAKAVHIGSSIFLASIPTALVSGLWLERFTRKHSDDVVDAVSKFFGHGPSKPHQSGHQDKPQDKHGKTTWPGPSASYSMPAAAAAFKGLAPQQQGWLSPTPTFFNIPAYSQPYGAAAVAAFSGHGVSMPKQHPAMRTPAIKTMYPGSMPSSRFAV